MVIGADSIFDREGNQGQTTFFYDATYRQSRLPLVTALPPPSPRLALRMEPGKPQRNRQAQHPLADRLVREDVIGEERRVFDCGARRRSDSGRGPCNYS